MKNLFKTVGLLLVAVFVISCSNEPERLTTEQINEALAGKQICYLSFMSSGDLKYDYPNRMRVRYVENGKEFGQWLTVEALETPEDEGIFDEKRSFAASLDELINFDINQVVENATSFIQKETNSAFEYFAIADVTVSAVKNWKGEKEIRKTLKLQATKKNETSEYKLSHKKLTEVQNYYEFEFEILEDSQVKYIDE